VSPGDPTTLLLSVPQFSSNSPLKFEVSNLKVKLPNEGSKRVSITATYENQGGESESQLQLRLREDPLIVGYVGPVLVPLNGTKDLELGGVAPFVVTSSAPGILSVAAFQVVTKVQLKGLKQGNANVTITDHNGEEVTIQCQVQAFTTQDVGGEPGDFEYAFSVDDPYNLNLLLNTSPRANHQGLIKQEWVFLYVELSDQQPDKNLFLFLTSNGAVPYSNDLDFATAVFHQPLDNPFDILGYFGMEDILPSGLGSINALTFGYAYSLQEFHSYGDLFSGLWAQQFVLGNTVTIKINGY
jgi:hypothetical protein